jgi:hypothetical protein
VPENRLKNNEKFLRLPPPSLIYKKSSEVNLTEDSNLLFLATIS